MEGPAGSSGGSAEGASEGRQPLTGPHLPPAAKVAKTQLKEKPPRRRPEQNEMKKPPCPQGTKNHAAKTSCFSCFALRVSNPHTRRVAKPRAALPYRASGPPHPSTKRKRLPPRGSLFTHAGQECPIKKSFHASTPKPQPSQAAYFHKLLYLAAMPSVRSTSLSTRPSTSS